MWLPKLIQLFNFEIAQLNTASPPFVSTLSFIPVVTEKNVIGVCFLCGQCLTICHLMWYLVGECVSKSTLVSAVPNFCIFCALNRCKYIVIYTLVGHSYIHSFKCECTLALAKSGQCFFFKYFTVTVSVLGLLSDIQLKLLSRSAFFYVNSIS